MYFQVRPLLARERYLPVIRRRHLDSPVFELHALDIFQRHCPLSVEGREGKTYAEGIPRSGKAEIVLTEVKLPTHGHLFSLQRAIDHYPVSQEEPLPLKSFSED